jgi:hypothetical protein
LACPGLLGVGEVASVLASLFLRQNQGSWIGVGRVESVVGVLISSRRLTNADETMEKTAETTSGFLLLRRKNR